MVHEPEQQQERPRPVLTPEQQAIREAGIRIADALGETLPEPRAQVGRIVRVLGIERAEALYQQTIATEAGGGMMLPNGSRRRTPGGVFFKLARDMASSRQRRFMFPMSKSQRERPAQPQPVPEVLIEIPNATGEVRTVKITLVGRPSRIIPKQGYIMTTMTATKVPALPKGMPTPPATPTVYTVYISLKQWAKVSQALANPEDILIVEGTSAYDPDLEGIAVYVTNTTTRQLQQALRAAQPGTQEA